MKIAKKILGVALALAMLVNVFAMFSSALAPDSAVDLTLRTDKTVYQPGDTVRITVEEQVIEAVGPVRIGAMMPIAYDSSKIQFPVTDVNDALVKNIGFEAHQAGYDDGISTISWTEDNLAMGDSIEEGHGWDSLVILGVCDDGLTTYEAYEKTDMFSFNMVIAEDCPDGEFEIGINKPSFANYTGSVNDNEMGGIYGEDDKYYDTTDNYSVGTVTIKVSSGEEAQVVEWSKAQIRFHGVGADRNFDNYTDKKFDVRTVAKISAENFNATFESEENAKAKITELGFVYATKSNVSDFNYETAKIVAKGGSATNYVKKSVTYMQNTGSEYIFTCLIENIADADHTDGVNCIAYVLYDGEYYFFNAPVSVDYSKLYNQYGPNA